MRVIDPTKLSTFREYKAEIARLQIALARAEAHPTRRAVDHARHALTEAATLAAMVRSNRTAKEMHILIARAIRTLDDTDRTR